MQDDRIRGSADSATGLVCVSRDGGGDWRRVLVPVSEVHGPHIAVTRGGDYAPLPEPMLAGYVDSAWVPLAWRCGKHGAGRMKLIVEPEFTDPPVLERLRAAGERCVHTLEFVERRRQRRRHRTMVGVVVPAGEGS